MFIACESTVGRNGAEMAAQVVEMKEAGAIKYDELFHGSPMFLPACTWQRCPREDGAEFSAIVQTVCALADGFSGFPK